MLTLYQFNTCPFCWKVKALMHLKQIPYQVVEVSPFGKKEIDFTDHKKVPILKDNDKVITESATIAQYIQKNYTELPEFNEREQEWMDWVDDTLVHYLPPLIHANFLISFQNFGYILKNGSFSPIKGFFVRLMGSIAMPRVAKRMKKKHNISNAREEFHEALDRWVEEGLRGQTFFAGNEAGVVDAAVYGILHSSHGMKVLSRALERNPQFAAWYQACDDLMAKPVTV